VGGISSLLNDENDALLVPPSDPEAMSFAIKRVLIDQRLATKLSVNGRRKVERFDWSIVLPKWEQLLNSIVEKSVVSNGRCGTQRQEVG
jgi:glycosyltransferase involved in cell wall biosynthesis